MHRIFVITFVLIIIIAYNYVKESLYYENHATESLKISKIEISGIE